MHAVKTEQSLYGILRKNMVMPGYVPACPVLVKYLTFPRISIGHGDHQASIWFQNALDDSQRFIGISQVFKDIPQCDHVEKVILKIDLVQVSIENIQA